MHWGWENEPVHSTRQQQLAQRMIDAGADAVVGGHPHVTQGANTYKGRPIVWSLGNFVFDGFSQPPGRTGWVLRMTVGPPRRACVGHGGSANGRCRYTHTALGPRHTLRLAG